MRRWNALRGFTFVETIATIVVIGLLAALMSQLMFQSLNFSDKNQKIQRDVQELVRLRTELESVCLQVNPPYWENSKSVFQKDAQKLNVRYWESSADSSLSIWVSDDLAIHVHTNDLDASWGPFPLAHVEYWESNGKKIGLTVRLSFAQVDQTFHFPWGSRPL